MPIISVKYEDQEIDSPRPASRSTKKTTAPRNYKTKNSPSVREKNRRVVFGRTRKKPSKHLKQGAVEYRTEPYFEFTGESSLGCAEKHKRRDRDDFLPRISVLKSEGGKSIDLYEDWRLMQYRFNIVMKRFLNNHGINSSVLPPCNTYDMWRSDTWRRAYKRVTKRGLDEDPCPDCDVRFFQDDFNERKFTFKIATASILRESRWKTRRYLNTVLVIGLPQHIAICIVREHSERVVFEYFDPAGPQGDGYTTRAVKQWATTYLQAKFSEKTNKKMEFHHITKHLCCQSDNRDVMCQTWIWYWVYWRMVRNAEVSELKEQIKEMIQEKSTLDHITLFNRWLTDLHNHGYYLKENKFEREAAIQSSPPPLDELIEALPRPSIEELYTESSVFMIREEYKKKYEQSRIKRKDV